MSLDRLDMTASRLQSSHHGLFLDVVPKSQIGVTIVIEKFAIRSESLKHVTVTIYACSEACADNTENEAKWNKVGCGAISNSVTEIVLTSPVHLVGAQKRGFYFHSPDSNCAIGHSMSNGESVASNTWFDVQRGPYSAGPKAFASVQHSAPRAMHGAIIFSVGPDPDQPTNKRRKVMQEALWIDTSFSDCTITCGARVLKCHRVVLGTASPVWSTALQSNFREGNNASISIDDFDPSVVETAVKYAYTSDIPADVGTDFIACLKLAHRYEMSSLVEVCAKSVIDNLTVDNVGQAVAVMNILSENKLVESLLPSLFAKVRLDEALNNAALRSLGRV